MAKKGRGSRRLRRRLQASPQSDLLVSIRCERWDCPNCRPGGSPIEYDEAPPPGYVFYCEAERPSEDGMVLEGCMRLPTTVAGLRQFWDPDHIDLMFLCDEHADEAWDPIDDEPLDVVGWLPFDELPEQDRNAHWRGHYALDEAMDDIEYPH